MLQVNHDPVYNGIYQENIIFEDSVQDLFDEEQWDDGDYISNENLNVFILPNQDEAQA